ncbi:hypothetical protein F5Y15DRAFT_425865 [Xylariaceae sp. FL0016]|nr:hypothetical protein F5Y15DRAFT_425865 [Xylariaceae sp. FL0016]
MPDWPKWKQVPESDAANGYAQAQLAKRQHTIRSYAILAVFASVVSIVSLGAVMHMLSSAQTLVFPSYLDTQFKYDCGNSSDEALAKGCVFDELLLSWIPSECPRRQEAKFMDYMNWTWPMYADIEGEQPLDRHQLSRWDNKEYFTTQREHSGHCMFIMLRFFDSVRYGNRVDSMAMHHPHARHCTQFILELLEETKDRDTIFGPFTIEYESC